MDAVFVKVNNDGYTKNVNWLTESTTNFSVISLFEGEIKYMMNVINKISSTWSCLQKIGTVCAVLSYISINRYI